MLAVTLFSVLALFPWTTLARDLYVAPNGSDKNSGTKGKPFATLERARDEIREMKTSGALAKNGTTVWLRGGDYLRTNALELIAADSGSPKARITWRAFQGETVRLLGGRLLNGFQTVTDPAVLSRLDKNAQGKVVQLNFGTLGLTDFGEMRSRGFARGTSASHCELFFGGKPMILARWPNEGAFEQIAGIPTGRIDEHGGTLGILESGFNYAGERPRHWQETTNLWVHGYWAWDWANSYEHVSSLDLETHLVKTAAPYGLYGFRKGQRFYFLNVLEELDQPGEWFLDRASKTLYFWPPDSVDSISANKKSNEIILSLLDQPFLKLNGASNVTFRSLTMEATRGNAVEIHGGATNGIAGCVIRNIGNSGVRIEGGQGHSVVGCDIFDTGDGGVTLNGGDRKTLLPGGHFVENCHFQRQGRWSKCYVPAVLMDGVGMRASHNLIHDHPHCAILFNGNDHLIEFNEIHHIALETGDVGAIYAGRNYTYRGNRMSYNFIHHTGGVGMGSMGIYMDDCMSGAEIFGNIFYKVQRAAFIGGGRDHQVINNVFVDCNHAVELDARGMDKTPVWRDMVDKTMRAHLVDLPQALYRSRYPDLAALDKYYGPPGGPSIEGAAFTGVPAENNVVATNISVGKWLRVAWHATPKMLRLENNLTNANPQFVEQPNDQSRAKDFALQRTSPAWKLGFQKLPVEKIGLYRDEFRKRLP